MRNYGIYTRQNDIQIWQLDRVTSKEDTEWAEEFNAQFGFQTLIVGPRTVFPNWLET
jgi:hypothetical protein